MTTIADVLAKVETWEQDESTSGHALAGLGDFSGGLRSRTIEKRVLRDALASFQKATAKRSILAATLDSFTKAHQWWLRQPSDKCNRWTRGLISGAYSPLSKLQDGDDVSPIEPHEPGSPFATGGDYDGNMPGWQHAEKGLRDDPAPLDPKSRDRLAGGP